MGMKLLLKKASVFFALSGFIYAIGVLYYNYLFEIQVSEVELLRKDTRVLLMGDSHMRHGIDDRMYHCFENRGMTSDCYYAIYCKLKAILNHSDFDSSNIAVVCLAYNYFSIKTTQRFAGVKATHWYDENQPILRSLEHYPADMGFPITENRFSLYLRTHLPQIENLRNFIILGKVKNFSSYIGSFNSKSVEEMIVDSDLLEKVIDRHYGSLNEHCANPHEISWEGYNMLCRIADLIQKKGVQLVLINLPQHQDYNRAVFPWVVQLHDEFANQLIEEYNVIYLDWHDMPMLNNYFLDYDHLNVEGAAKVTPLLYEELKSRGLLKGESEKQ